MLKKFFIAIVAFFVILVAVALAIPLFFKKEINLKIKSFINEKLNAKVNFDHFDLSLITTFPNLGIISTILWWWVPTVLLMIPWQMLKKIQVNVNLMSVFKGRKYQIESIYFAQPNIYAKVLKSGKANWDIMKPSPKSVDTAKTDFKVALQKYIIENGNIIYDDKSLGFYMDLHQVNHSGTGDFTQDNFTLKTQSDIEKLTVKYGSIAYLKNAKLSADLPLEVDLKKMKFTFGKNKVLLNELILSAVGISLCQTRMTW
ncbi:hypothetical protein [Pedobacter miscanthi]|uniref:AsmA family protein n=1 Tax=Pedobacter miscanthi TaxID=2259170 RepID=UPI002931398C|nr:hypothetical protein [Pedobacter miscanthi]